MRVLKKEIWPYCVRVDNCDFSEIGMWLGQNLGPFKGRWNFVDHYGIGNYYFKRGSDATMFRLRWG